MEEFSAHIAAAKAGCPKCGSPLDDLKAEHAEIGWKNRCCNSKCSGIREYVVSYETRENLTSRQAPASQHLQEPKDIIHVPDTWEYIEDYNRWCNAEGKIVKIKELENEELLDSMHLLKEFNFAKMGSTIIWMKDLPRKPGKHQYPKDVLKVGKDLALAKLEEMKEVAIERGLLGIST